MRTGTAVHQFMTAEQMVSEHAPIRSGRRPPRGVVALWTLLMIPVLVVLFAVVVEGVHLWLARVELENALEASALAAVKEWAESTSGVQAGWTNNARLVGQQYAAANTINQTPVVIGDNTGPFDPTTNPNENGPCDGNLVFGAVIENDPEYVVGSYQKPSCTSGTGRVLVDVTTNNLDKDDHSWGISFPTDTDPWFNQNIQIDRIVIDLDPNNTGNLRFNFNVYPPVLSPNNQPAVQGSVGGIASLQHDNYGFVGWTKTTGPTNPTFTPPDGAWPSPGQSPQIVFSPTTGIATVLTISFHSHDDGTNSDAGFSPGDRFRFGTDVERRNQGGGWATADADDIGDVGAKITVFFKDSNDVPWPSAAGITGTFIDTGYSRNDCGGQWELEDLGNGNFGNYHLIVHPIASLTPGSTPLIARDLPCPLTSAANNDNQSIVMALGVGVGGGNHVVRAQATDKVPSLIAGFMGINFGGPFTVSASTTAMYDCELRRPRLIRVEKGNFHCPTTP